jgi:pyruvate dehydrogenase E2 component (dihydrolipoamide acetyltransferase)
MAVKVVMPRLTDTMLQGTIAEWTKREGDSVSVGDALYAVETDKAVVDVSSSVAGVLLKILVPNGQAVDVGGPVAVVGERGEDIQAALAPAPRVRSKGKQDAPRAAQETPNRILATPAARRRAKEANIDLAQVRGSGEDGMISEKDILAYLVAERAGTPSRQGAAPLSAVGRAMFDRMTLSAGIPQVTTVTECDATDLLNLSRAQDITITTYVVRAVVEALKVYPLLNSSLEGDRVVQHESFNIGISVATPRGLIVPVLREAQTKAVPLLAEELAALAVKAREGRLSLEELAGATFTVTNSGVFGSLLFTPRIAPPQSAIVGIGKILKQPVVRDDAIVIRSMMYLCLSYDHRHIDGETAVKFLQQVKQGVETPAKL